MNPHIRQLARKTGATGAYMRFRRYREPTWKRGRLDDAHLRLLLALAMPQDANCIDVGANEGAILREMVRAAPRGKHLAFEPIAHLAEALKAAYPSVDVRQVALSDTTGETSFVHVTGDEAYSGFREQRYNGDPARTAITVHAARLDDLLDTSYRPALVKVDVEGAERQVLAGAYETIARHKPIVVFEHHKHGAASYGTRPQHLHELLTDAGLRIFDIDGEGPCSVAYMDEHFERQDLWTYVAHR